MEIAPFIHQALMLRKIREPICKLKNRLSVGVSWKTEGQAKWSETGLHLQSEVKECSDKDIRLEISTRFGSIWLQDFRFLNTVSPIHISESWSDTDIQELLNLSISLMDPEIREILGCDVRGRWHASEMPSVCNEFVLSLISSHAKESHSFTLLANPEVIHEWTSSGKWLKNKLTSSIDMGDIQTPGQVIIGCSTLSTDEMERLEVGSAIFLEECYISDNAVGVIDFGGVKARARLLDQYILSIEYLSA